MPRLRVFNSISLDGFFTDANNDMSFARNPQADPEWDNFVAGNASGGGAMMIFGRVTYDMMAGFWPTPAAMQSMPVVAKTMNAAPKVVFSRTLDRADWNNTRLVENDLPGEIRRLKNSQGMDMIIFGSGTIISQLTHERLIDEYTFIVIPVVLGRGRTMFESLGDPVRLHLLNSRQFPNGNMLLNYKLEG